MGNIGIIIADTDTNLVKSQANIIEQAKTNTAFTSAAVFLEHVLTRTKARSAIIHIKIQPTYHPLPQ